MSKPYKIKRGKMRYRKGGFRKGPTPFGIAMIVVGCAVLFFLGWSLYQPVYNLITGNIKPSQNPSGPAVTEPVTSPVEQDPDVPQVTASAERKLIYLPKAVMLDNTRFDAFLATAQALGANGVMMDLKDGNGVIHYKSAVPLALSSGAVVADAVDLPAIIAKLKEKNLTASVRIYAFDDHIAPAANKDLAIRYGPDPNFIWLDNAAESGGKPWLNPYAPDAQKYITDLSAELVGMGVSEIVLDGFYFPTMVGSELTGYGDTANGVTKDACLKTYLAALTETLSVQKAEVTLCVSASSVFGDTALFGGVKPTELGAKTLLVNAMPASYGAKMELLGQVVEAPAKDPARVSAFVSSELKKLLPQGTKLSMFVQGYTDTTLAQGVNKTYARADITAQIQALSGQDVKDYLIFHPTGDYPAQ